jgi:xylitol oxidase
VAFDPARVRRPASVDELRRIVAGSTRVRALGTGHSFSPLLSTPGELVSVAGLPPVLDLDAGRRSVTVAGGVRYGEVATYLHRAGRALEALASLPHISVAGAVATGTHGSGDTTRGLAAAVSGLELVTAGGDVVGVRRGEPDFAGLVVGLGAAGIVTRLTLDVVPSYEVRQYVYEDLPLDGLDFDAVSGSAYSVSMFTDWAGPRFTQVWLKQLVREAPPGFSARPADGPRHPIPGQPPGHTTGQGGVPGPWYARLPHFRLEFTPSSGHELQAEYLLPRGSAGAALAALDGIRARIAPVLQVCEVRTVAADDLWLSPCYGRDTVAFHFTWVPDAGAVAPVLDAIEERLVPLGARPHWGKLFRLDPATVRAGYERAGDFVALVRRYDPDGKFRNGFLDRYLPANG